jgi:hypothetical protein
MCLSSTPNIPEPPPAPTIPKDDPIEVETDKPSALENKGGPFVLRIPRPSGSAGLKA